MHSSKFWLGLIIAVQTLVYVLAGVGKVYIHMDEAYSLALAQYDKIDITANGDFYDHWHDSEYFQDYLAVQEGERWNFSPVYENQKNDVHPPLYYLLLRLGMEIGSLANGGEFSKWPGIILNMAIMAGCTVFLCLILCKLLAKEKDVEWKALIVTLAAGLTVAAVSTVVYIRMYALLTLMVLATLYVHLKLREQKRPKWGWYAMVAVIAVLGTLTQYYYLFFLVGLGLVTVVQYWREKQWVDMTKYLGSLVVAGGLVLLIWPHILQHMFFGYRGQGVLGNLMNPGILLGHLWDYLKIVDYNVFHHLLLAIVIAVVVLVIYRQVKRLPRQKLPREFWWIWWPTLSYFGLAAVASPFMELRYIMPVCGLIFALVVWGLYWLLKGIAAERLRDVIVGAVMAVILVVAPVQIMTGMMRVELLYRDRQLVMELAEEHKDAPAVYFITMANNRFLDNILPFATLSESYLALDLEPVAGEKKVEEILKGKDLSKGLVIFVSDQYEQEDWIKIVQEVTGLEKAEFVQILNTCSVYYLS